MQLHTAVKYLRYCQCGMLLARNSILLFIMIMCGCTFPPKRHWCVSDSRSFIRINRIAVMLGQGVPGVTPANMDITPTTMLRLIRNGVTGKQSEQEIEQNFTCHSLYLRSLAAAFSKVVDCVPFDSLQNRDEGLYLPVMFPGNAYFPTKGSVKLAGNTLPALDARISRKLRRIFGIDAVCVVWPGQCEMYDKPKVGLFLWLLGQRAEYLKKNNLFLQIHRCDDGKAIARICEEMEVIKHMDTYLSQETVYLHENIVAVSNKAVEDFKKTRGLLLKRNKSREKQ